MGNDTMATDRSQDAATLLSLDSCSSDESIPSISMPLLPNDVEDTKIVREWACEVCKTAIFDDYDAARQHELLCGLEVNNLHFQLMCGLEVNKLNLQSDSTETTQSSSLVSICREISELEEREPSQYDPHERETKQQRQEEQKWDTKNDQVLQNGHRRTPSPRKKKKSLKKNKWVCDVCRIAKFVSYVDAYRHEKLCSELSSQGGVEKQYRGEELKFTAKNNKRESHHLRPTSPKQHTKTKQRDVTWLCGVCEVCCFDDYDEACRHHDMCSCRRRELDPFVNLPGSLEL